MRWSYCHSYQLAGYSETAVEVDVAIDAIVVGSGTAAVIAVALSLFSL